MLTRFMLLLALLSVGTGAAANDELESLAWLEGHWVTEAFGGLAEETWLPVSGNAMYGVFRLTVDGRLDFSEFLQVTADAGRVVMRFKHFRPDYSTWEGDAPPMELEATEIAPGKVVFDSIDKESSSRIVYTLVGTELHVTVSGVDGVLRFSRK